MDETSQQSYVVFFLSVLAAGDVKHASKAAEWEEETGERWSAWPLYLIGSWSSLFSLLWMIFIPLFLARGHPERLQTNDSDAKVEHNVRACALGRDGGGREEGAGGGAVCPSRRTVR